MFETRVKIHDKNVINPTRIVIISDTHITHTGYQFNKQVFDEGLRKINKIKDVDLFLHLGDLTHFGTLKDYEYALDLFKQFDPLSKEAPLFCLIGNHDTLNVGYLLFEEMIGERFIHYENEHIYMLGVDSTKPDLPSGIIHHNVINSIESKLNSPERQEKLKIICFHHQLIPIPNTGRERSAIDDSGNMLKMLIDTNTDLVLNGHRHISNLYSVETTNKNFFIFNAGTFSSHKTRYREEFTYSIIDIEDNKLNIKVIPILGSQKPKNLQRIIKYYSISESDPKRQPYCKLIQFSNTLISTNENRDIVDNVINKVNDLSNVDLIIHCGNLTKNGHKEEYLLAKEKLDQLKYPHLIVPGYTDMRPPAWKYWEKYIGSQNPTFENEKLFFQGINSTTVDSRYGFIGRKRLSRAIENIQERNDKQVIGVAFFHPCLPTPVSVWRTELSDSGDVLSQFASSKADLILNSSPSINFNIKIGNSVFSNGGNLERNRFDQSFLEIDLYEKGLIIIREHNIDKERMKPIAKYNKNF